MLMNRTIVWGPPYDWHRLRHALRSVVVGGVVGLLVFGGLYVIFTLIPDEATRNALLAEDGFFEAAGALAFLVAAILQLVLFWRSDVPDNQRLIPFMRRNVFYLGIGLVLLFAFAEEISWGQRIFGWATPAEIVELNVQGETNIHNLVGIEDSLFNMTRAFNMFWLGYVVLAPISAVVLPLLALVYRRVSLPLAPLVIAGLFLGHFASWRVFSAVVGQSGGDEIEEAFLAVCWLTLGAVQVLQMRRRGRAEPA
jgi:hypothetical protein